MLLDLCEQQPKTQYNMYVYINMIILHCVVITRLLSSIGVKESMIIYLGRSIPIKYVPTVVVVACNINHCLGDSSNQKAGPQQRSSTQGQSRLRDQTRRPILHLQLPYMCDSVIKF